MSRAKKEPHAMPFVTSNALTGAPAFAPCPVCGVLVQVRTWVAEQGWTPLAIPVSAAFGYEHSVEKGTCTPDKENATSC